MSTDFEYRSGDQAAPRSVAQIPLFLGTCADGDVGKAYSFDPGADVAGDLGPGVVSALALAHGQIGPCVVSPVDPHYAALPAVSQTGGGPALTVALTDSNGPHDTAALTLTVDDAAKNASVSFDGTSEAQIIPIPPEGPAVLRGKVDISGGADLEGLTLVWTAPAAKTLTFGAGSLAGAAAGLHAALATTIADQTVLKAALLAAGLTAIAAHGRRLLFTVGGATPAHGPTSADVVGVDPQGNAQTETVALVAAAGTYKSTKLWGDVSSYTLKGATDVDATVAVGYSSRFADANEIATAFDALAAAAPLAVRARIHQASTGEQYLETYSTATGAAVTETIDDATSTAHSVLGFTSADPANLTATGTTATHVFEWLGVTVTFPAGPYTAKTIYEIALTGPRGAVGDYVDALNAAIADYQNHPFGYVVVAEDMATNANARALYDALRAIADTKRHDPDDPVLFDVVTPTKLHAADPDKTTNDAAIAAWETDLLTAMTGAAVSLENIAVDDCYVAGPPSMPGTFRRPTSWAAAFKRSSLDRIGGNPCDGRAPLVSLVAADGKTKARDEAKRSTKLAGLAGPGFWALKSMQDGGVKFAPSASRAGSLDRYRNPGVVAFALEASRKILPTLQGWEGTWETDPENPKAADPDLLEHRAGILTTLITSVAFPENEPKNVAAFTVKLTAPTILDDGNATARIDFNPLAVGEKVTAIITATGVALETPGA